MRAIMNDRPTVTSATFETEVTRVGDAASVVDPWPVPPDAYSTKKSALDTSTFVRSPSVSPK